MQYHKLSEAQLNEMHEEFALFLAAQGINKTDWDQIKATEPHKIEAFLRTFSDMVWDKILTNCEYLEFSTADQLFLFKTKKQLVDVRVVKINSAAKIDLTTTKGFENMLSILNTDQVDVFAASKSYSPSRNRFIYDYLKKGATLSKGERYRRLKSYFSNSPK